MNKMNILKIKIVFVSSDYPANNHMSYVFVQQLVHALIEKGVQITVVAPQSITHFLVHREPLLPILSKGVTDSGREYQIYRPYIISFGNYHLLSGFERWWNYRVIDKLLTKLNPDILYTHFWSSARWVTYYANQNHKPIFVACGEGDDAIEKMVKVGPERELRLMSSLVKGVISVSSENKRKCVSYKLISPDKVEVIPNSVDLSLFKRRGDRELLRDKIGAKKDDFVVAFVGVFNARKGPDRLAKAISELNDPSIKVIFIGKSFNGYSYDFDCPGILFKGSIDHRSLPEYLNAADIFVLPTQKEGCSNAIVEALAVGLPVVSSNGSFNDDILDSQNSLRINPDSVNEIKESILTLKNNEKLREHMRYTSEQRHDSYSLDARAQKILTFLERMYIQ